MPVSAVTLFDSVLALLYETRSFRTCRSDGALRGNLTFVLLQFHVRGIHVGMV